MSQESQRELTNPLHIRLDAVGLLDNFTALLAEYSLSDEVVAGLEAILKEHAPLSKKYFQGLIDLQRVHRVSPDFFQRLGVLLAGVKTKNTKRNKATSKKDVGSTVSTKKAGPKKSKVKVTKVVAEVAGPIKEGLVLKVVVPWDQILSNTPPEIIEKFIGNSGDSSPSASGNSNTAKEVVASPKIVKSNTSTLSDEELFKRYQSALTDPAADSMWDQILFEVTGSSRVSLDRLAQKCGSDKDTVRGFLQTEYQDIKKYVEIRLEGDHVSANHK